MGPGSVTIFYPLPAVTRSGEPKICDFGLAQPFQGRSLTECIGTIFNMAPEVFDTRCPGYGEKYTTWQFGIVMAQVPGGCPPTPPPPTPAWHPPCRQQPGLDRTELVPPKCAVGVTDGYGCRHRTDRVVGFGLPHAPDRAQTEPKWALVGPRRPKLRHATQPQGGKPPLQI